MDEKKYKNLKLGERGAKLSILVYVLLSCFKLIAAYFTGSAALKADGLNNVTDIIASIAVLVGLRISQRPPDSDHKYGHWKSEAIASLIAAIIMFAVGAEVLMGAFSSLFGESNEAPNIFAGYVALISAVIMYGVYRYNKNLAKKINSNSLMAVAADNRSDALVSIGAAIGIFGSQLNLPWLDPVTAIIVGLLIVRTAWEIFSDATHQLTDGFDQEKIEEYEETVEQIDGVKSIKEIKGRLYGNNIVVDIVICVEGTLDINKAHDLATLVEEKLINQHDVYDVHVHVEPA
ncbi:cation diffusion facilitator family transporter [Cytobacillus purgationiresistens]|uniref:Cation diffusion facilitator family transporter n=1 Tax=Cytobacillus purgationiresistens TaxID=863449 RepID=A0ABU0APR7_9BACI|nr:cation diffusion facilitator family transporter [Cytobacillus purgationiresistens]MDQ0272767.1 cation diffusion facilitator family transporter [Cytobacillus purgationiresistens]